ncbi:transcriptional regulator [ANME-1 cluster archaeon ex4572_4]|nr:MAG: transcriptional regulator [ANME-1 cluster archaeon ex4572_4]PXF51605.1 MAG: transcriptional regulator [Methanophagales archaeon]HDN68386.1 helix-turn-helix domain-containing protein [Methanomicrobia archaeon]
MNIADGIVTEIFRNGKELPALLTRAIKQSLGVSVGEFSEKSGVPASTLYKILSGQRDPNLQTFRRIINTIRAIEEAELGGKRGRGSAAKEKRKFIAIICSRGCLDVLERTTITTENPRATFDLKEYAVASIEEAILAAVQAEKDGASALVCAPIVSSTVEKVVSIPLTTIRPRSSVARAIELAAKKTS